MCPRGQGRPPGLHLCKLSSVGFSIYNRILIGELIAIAFGFFGKYFLCNKFCVLHNVGIYCFRILETALYDWIAY